MLNKNKSRIHTLTHIQLPAALLCQLLLECAKCTTKETGSGVYDVLHVCLCVCDIHEYPC